MKTFFLVCQVLCIATYAQALICLKCHGASSFLDCDVSGELKECMPNQDSCETTVRRYGDHLRVMKGCKNADACKNNQMQNGAKSGKSTQCNSDQRNSVCTCCCSDNLCNAGAPTCVTFYQESGPVNDCPRQPENFPHGEIECYNDNKAGAVCEYKCTGKDYGVWPPKRNKNVCLRNGTWAHEAPCCARPCPPYYLYDAVTMFYLDEQFAQDTVLGVLSQDIDGVIAEDASLSSTMYFSGEPRTETVIKFNDYGADSKRYQELVRERMVVVNEGPVNMGAAIQYALDNLLTPEAGMRDSRVPKAISIITNRNADDDTKAAVAEARRRDILIYVFAYEPEGTTLDREQFLEITGEEEHLFIFDRHFGDLSAAHLDDMNKHFCSNPCDHVLHEHS